MHLDELVVLRLEVLEDVNDGLRAGSLRIRDFLS
jgi:hypothetical protein